MMMSEEFRRSVAHELMKADPSRDVPFALNGVEYTTIAVSRLTQLEGIERRLIRIRDDTRPVGNRPVGPTHRLVTDILGWSQ